MGYVKWKATTKGKSTVEDFDTLKNDVLLDTKMVVVLEEIPLKLIIN